MPTYARCPQCHASVPRGADWCSLCHVDLRPAPSETAAALTPARGAGPAHAARPAHAATPAHAAESVPAVTAAPLPGRHRRAEPAPILGRHRPAPAAAGALREEVDALVADAPLGADGKPDLDVLTSQLMARLATTEGSAAALPDIDSVPGGKWGVLLGGMTVLTAVLVALATLVGALFFR